MAPDASGDCLSDRHSRLIFIETQTQTILSHEGVARFGTMSQSGYGSLLHRALRAHAGAPHSHTTQAHTRSPPFAMHDSPQFGHGQATWARGVRCQQLVVLSADLRRTPGFCQAEIMHLFRDQILQKLSEVAQLPFCGSTGIGVHSLSRPPSQCHIRAPTLAICSS